MSPWPLVELGQICEFKYGKSLPASRRVAGDFPVYGSNGVVGTHTVALTSGSTIVIGRKGSFGEVHLSEGPCWPIDTTYFVDSSGTDVDLRWLAHLLPTLRLTELNRAAAIPGLNREDAYRRTLLLPPLDEQRHIAATLDQADALRAKRRQALAHLDDLTQSIFFDVFGELSRYPIHALVEVTDISSGLTKGRRLNGQEVRAVPYLAVSNVQDGYLRLDNVKEIEATDSEITRFALRRGDLVMTEGGDPDKLGRGTVWNDELPLALHQNHIFRVRIRDESEILPGYLASFIATKEARSYFRRSAKQTTGIASINMTQLKALPIHVPEVEMQRRYLKVLEAVNFQRDRLMADLRAHEELARSFKQRAFATSVGAR